MSGSCVSDHPGRKPWHSFLKQGLTGYLDAIVALRKISQALRGWTVHAKDLPDLLNYIAESQLSPYVSDEVICT